MVASEFHLAFHLKQLALSEDTFDLEHQRKYRTSNGTEVLCKALMQQNRIYTL